MADVKRKWKEVSVDNGEVWDREEPLEGVFVKTEDNVGPNGSKMYTIKTDDGEVKVWGSTVLDDKLMSVPAGQYVKIQYEGLLKGKRGTDYHAYKVFFDEAFQAEPTDEADDSIDLSEVFPE